MAGGILPARARDRTTQRPNTLPIGKSPWPTGQPPSNLCHHCSVVVTVTCRCCFIITTYVSVRNHVYFPIYF